MGTLFQREEIVRSARISEDGVYRYWLRRIWDDDLAVCCFIMLNPSTADAMTDDATIRSCIRLAKVHGFGGIHVVNLFALRSTNQKRLAIHPDPAGPENTRWIDNALLECSKIICAWGTNCYGFNTNTIRIDAMRFGQRLYCFARNKDGSPKHPLYLPNTAKMEIWI